MAYYPTNAKNDGTFRTVQVKIAGALGQGKFVARTRNGYCAPTAAASDAAGN